MAVEPRDQEKELKHGGGPSEIRGALQPRRRCVSVIAVVPVKEAYTVIRLQSSKEIGLRLA